jgi:hypothetical protein
MTRNLKPRAAFKSEADERAFSETHDSTDHADWVAAERSGFR